MSRCPILVCICLKYSPSKNGRDRTPLEPSCPANFSVSILGGVMGILAGDLEDALGQVRVIYSTRSLPTLLQAFSMVMCSQGAMPGTPSSLSRAVM